MRVSIDKQKERFRKGFPWLDIVAAATPERGIKVLDKEEEERAAEYTAEFPVRGKCKFVPASGAASRMFKDIFAGMESLMSGTDVAADSSLARLAASIDRFAFWSEELFGKEVIDSPDFRLSVARKTLTDEGLGYGSKPKGVILFHRNSDGTTRTAFEEHLVEGQEYLRNDDSSVNLTITVSPEHLHLFEALLDRVKPGLERKFGVKYNVRFTFQDPETDTVAVDSANKLFLKEDGTPLFRPAGHGALIGNLNEVEEELVSIKNIDNVSCERYIPLISRYKKVLIGKCLELRDRIFMYLEELDRVTWNGMVEPLPFLRVYNALMEDTCATEECMNLCNDIETFLREELCIELPASDSCKDRVESIRKILDRPVRVCGMVKNEGQPGGGPFIIREKDGSTSLQILESVQINPADPFAVQALSSATHFNPVDIVCCTFDYRGNKFDLTRFVDEETGFISHKSYHGHEIKALELPGLWNGSMSGWNTMFVEVPAETFNPVKVVLDLLKDAHQG